jgi:NAD+ synthase/NAD+ synthase (glutamine-hydrolysing)
MILTLAQINPTVGDLAGNAGLILDHAARAAAGGVDLVVYPELALCGYPPKDLLLADGFVAACERWAAEVAAKAPPGVTLVFGTPLAAGRSGVHNGLVACRGGTITARYAKRLLPTYDVFDEDRYFEPGSQPVVVDVPGKGGVVRVGLSVCEDLWKGEDAGFAQRYLDQKDPVEDLVAAGAQVIVNPSASPFVLGKGRRHREILSRHAVRHGVVVAAVNQVGGNDDLIFDGHSAVFGPDGVLAAAWGGFEAPADPFAVAVSGPAGGFRATLEKQGPVEDPLLSVAEESLAFRALVLGVRDYCRKTGFSRAILGLSGGIDSALTAVVAAAALGPANVLGVGMPGPYSSEHSVSDARDLAERLGLTWVVAPIAAAFGGAAEVLEGAFGALNLPRLGATLPDLTEENLQSRVRGTVLMGLSNRTGAIVLTTGNKSEMAVGYCTLYGDMNGGLAVLSDVSKNLVYRVSRWVNHHHAVLGFAGPPIPQGSLTKPPSAELRPNQTDQDSLPPYDVLDEVLRRYVEGRQDPARIAAQTGFDAGEVNRVCRLIDLSEYKRRQAATGLKVTTVAFGSGRRVPIAQRWRPWAAARP